MNENVTPSTLARIRSGSRPTASTICLPWSSPNERPILIVTLPTLTSPTTDGACAWAGRGG
jgi:hypothetical protein